MYRSFLSKNRLILIYISILLSGIIILTNKINLIHEYWADHEGIAKATIISPQDKYDKNNQRINYALIRGLKFNNIFFDRTICNVSRHRLTPNLKTPGLLDFNVEISTNLKILQIGDSVGAQYALALSEAMGASVNNMSVTRMSSLGPKSIVESIFVSPTRSGGAVGGWRITGILSRSKLDMWEMLPNHRGGGWMLKDVWHLRHELLRLRKGNDTGFTEIDTFDVIIHQLPLGWLRKPLLPQFTHDVLSEVIQLSYEYFGAKTVILQTVHASNNIENIMEEFLPINQIITEFVHSYAPPTDGKGVENVMLMDVGAFSIHLYAENTVHMGFFNISEDKRRYDLNATILGQILNPLMRYRLNSRKTHQFLVGTLCREIGSKLVSNNCKKNRITRDGMHWCMDTTAGRFNGVVACLLKCVYHEPTTTTMSSSSTRRNDLRECEKKCNERYMNLRPVSWEDGSKLENY